MKMISQAIKAKDAGRTDWVSDTTFVLFFLAMEFGRSVRDFSLDSFLLFATLLVILVAPYFLPNNDTGFGDWLAGRSMIALLAVCLGALFSQSLGVVLPEMFRFLPMTLLIATAMMSCFFQFYSVVNFRDAR